MREMFVSIIILFITATTVQTVSFNYYYWQQKSHNHVDAPGTQIFVVQTVVSPASKAQCDQSNLEIRPPTKPQHRSYGNQLMRCNTTHTANIHCDAK